MAKLVLSLSLSHKIFQFSTIVFDSPSNLNSIAASSKIAFASFQASEESSELAHTYRLTSTDHWSLSRIYGRLVTANNNLLMAMMISWSLHDHLPFANPFHWLFLCRQVSATASCCDSSQWTLGAFSCIWVFAVGCPSCHPTCNSLNLQPKVESTKH